MSLKKVLLASSLLVSSAVATNSRVDAMGKSSTFIMDDISIFDNPANIGIYPNFLVGEFGSYADEELVVGQNRDPQQPWFGGIFSMGLGDDMGLDPKVSIAGAFNRKDDWFKYLPDGVIVSDPLNDYAYVDIPEPITNFDGFLGMSDEEGNLFGMHIYAGIQDGIQDDGVLNSVAFAQILKLDIGTNYQYSEDIDWETALGIGRVAFGNMNSNPFSGNYSFYGFTRMFSTIEEINGELVPAASFEIIDAGEKTIVNADAGIGVNVSLDRGFFWLGLEGVLRQVDHGSFTRINASTPEVEGKDGTLGDLVNSQGDTLLYIVEDQQGKNDRLDRTRGIDTQDELGGRISFGIERNIWYDWFVIRVGGQKEILWKECQVNNATSIANDDISPLCGGNGQHWKTNAIGDGTAGDHVGFGFGINVEEKLKVDAVLAEDVLFRNPFQGSGRWVSRISASYSF